jgi:chorismate--pyruvate lyase
MLFRARNTDWHNHVNAVNPSPQIRGWLIDRSSLTSKLIAHCSHFRVQRLRQQRAPCLLEERAVVGLSKRVKVHEREVLLRCDDVPVVFAHTIVPMTATASDWPFFSSLGERSLGTTLFGDPLVLRGALQFARLYGSHPLVQRARAAVGVPQIETPLFARRCLFRRKNGLLLVTEMFLPTLLNDKQSNR